MIITQTNINNVLILEPSIYKDARGYFFESFNQRAFNDAVGREVLFVQDNQSVSKYGVLRGLHYQLNNPQGKLVRVTEGEVLDVAVDLRLNSPTFGQHVSVVLSSENNKQLWIPEGLAHGFIVRSKTATFAYKTTDYWNSSDEHTIKWNDETLNINWNDQRSQFQRSILSPDVSAKDNDGNAFKDSKYFN